MAYFMPTRFFDKVTDISSDILKELNIQAILLDIDNTLAAHGDIVPFKGVTDWVRELQNQGFKLMIISNSNLTRTKSFANAVGILDFIENAGKPLRENFYKAADILDVKRENVLVVGDQIFTDILGANLSGMKSVLVEPQLGFEPWFIRVKRFFEKPFKWIITSKK